MLQKIQDEECIRAGNKITGKHVGYESNKMKVKLAAQVFSRSVAMALKTMKDIGQPGFDDVDATVDFILDIDW